MPTIVPNGQDKPSNDTPNIITNNLIGLRGGGRERLA